MVGEPDPVAPPSYSCSVLSLSKPHRHDHTPATLSGVYVTIHNQLFKALCDTGAEVSFIDPVITLQLDIPTKSIDGLITFAAHGTEAPRFGVTVPISATIILFLKPIQTHNLIHSFELLPMPQHSDHLIIIGMDLIPKIFSKEGVIPICLLPNNYKNNNHKNIDNTSISVITPPNITQHLATPTTGIDQAIYSLSSLPVTSSPSMALQHELDINLTRDNNIGDNEGEGRYPTDEQPVRVQAQTPTELEQQYAAKRNKLLASPLFQQLLSTNASIKQRCNIPEAVLKLHLDLDRIGGHLYTRQYQLPQKLLTRADVVVQRWLSTKVIIKAPVGCRYNTPLVVAPKKDEQGTMTGIRVCLDLRKLNRAQVDIDHFEIPYIRTVLEHLAGCRIFGEYDLSEAYLQIPLHPDSQPYTAFSWGGQQYMFTVCPFGLSVMPSHFQRLMAYVFRDLTFTIPYFDNIPFGSSTWEEHHSHACAILSRLNQYDLRIKTQDFKVGQAHLDCLGHTLTGTGIALNKAKAAKFGIWPRPTNGKELASALGFATFLRSYIRHFGEITASLEAIKRSKSAINWTPTLTNSWNLLQHAITNAPCLNFADFTRPFYVATDASGVGIGGVLYQPKLNDDINDTTREDIKPNNIIAIVSKKLNDTQRRYSAYKKELYAIVYCLRQFHPWIWGHKLFIITDHMPLTHMLQSPTLSNALQQWLDVILDYEFTIKHRPGILHVIPDALSRMYESMYSTTWGIPTKGTQQVINNLQLETMDVDLSPDGSKRQHNPIPTHPPTITVTLNNQPTSNRHVFSSSMLSSGGGNRVVIDTLDDNSDSDTSNKDMDEAEIEYSSDDEFIPEATELLEVKQSNQQGAGYGLFARRGISTWCIYR